MIYSSVARARRSRLADLDCELFEEVSARECIALRSAAALTKGFTKC
jgi:hypothetical protein